MAAEENYFIKIQLAFQTEVEKGIQSVSKSIEGLIDQQKKLQDVVGEAAGAANKDYQENVQHIKSLQKMNEELQKITTEFQSKQEIFKKKEDGWQQQLEEYYENLLKSIDEMDGRYGGLDDSVKNIIKSFREQMQIHKDADKAAIQQYNNTIAGTKELTKSISEASANSKELADASIQSGVVIKASGESSTAAMSNLNDAINKDTDDVSKLADQIIAGFDDSSKSTKKTGSTFSEIGKIASNLYVQFGSLFAFIDSGLSIAIERAEQFSNTLYRGVGSMEYMTVKSFELQAGLVAGGDKMVEMMKDMRNLGATEKDFDELAKSAVAFSTAMGASAATTASFMMTIKKVTGDANQATASMAYLANASKEFGLSGEDVNEIMQSVTSNARKLAFYGPDSMRRYTEGMVAAAAAAKNLGMSASEVIKIFEKTKDPTAYAGLFGGKAFGMSADEKMEKLAEMGPKLAEQMSKLTSTASKHRFIMKVSAQTGWDESEVEKNIAALSETWNVKQKALKLNIDIKSAEKSFNDILSNAQSASTGVVAQIKQMADRIGQMAAMIAAPLMPVFKMVFQVIDGLLSAINMFIAPIARVVTQMIGWLDVSEQIGELFEFIKSVAMSVGKIVAVFVASVFGPFVIAAKALLSIFTGVWEVLKVILSPIIYMFSIFTDGVMEVFNWIGKAGAEIKAVLAPVKAVLDAINEKIKKFIDFVKPAVTFFGKIFGVAIGILGILGAVKIATWLISGGAASIAAYFWESVVALKAMCAEMAKMRAEQAATKIGMDDNTKGAGKMWDKFKGFFKTSKDGKKDMKDVADTVGKLSGNTSKFGDISKKALGWMRSGLSGIGKSLTGVTRLIGSAFSGLGTMIWGIFTSIGTAIMGVVSTVFAYIQGAVVAFMASNPLGWVLAAVAAIVGVVYLVYKYWDDIADICKVVGKAIWEFICSPIDYAVKAFKWLLSWFGADGEESVKSEKKKQDVISETADQQKKYQQESADAEKRAREFSKQQNKELVQSMTKDQLEADRYANNQIQIGQDKLIEASKAAFKAAKTDDEKQAAWSKMSQETYIKDQARDMNLEVENAGRSNANAVTTANAINEAVNEMTYVAGTMAAMNMMMAPNMIMSTLGMGLGGIGDTLGQLMGVQPTPTVQMTGNMLRPSYDKDKMSKKNLEQLKFATDYLKKIAEDDRILDLLNRYLPEMPEQTSDAGLSRVANQWM